MSGTPQRQAWQTLGGVETERLRDARLQIHWAAQTLAAIGYTHIPLADDDSQSNMGWVDGMQILAGRLAGTELPWFGALRAADLTLLLMDVEGNALAELALSGKTLDEAHRFLEETIAQREASPQPTPLKRPSYEMPPHELARGATFRCEDPPAFEQIARCLHDANIIMGDLHARMARSGKSTPPRVWPHHFDMGMLVSLEENGDTRRGRSIGIGYSPGDEGIVAPYWYMNPYPAPDPPPKVWPALPHGARWHTEGWTGAIFEWEAQIAAPDAEAQQQHAREVVDAAVAGLRSLLEG